MNLRRAFAISTIALLSACSSATEDAPLAESSDAIVGSYDTPDPHNLWLRGVDLSKLAIGEETVLPDEQRMFEQFADTVNEMQDGLAKQHGEKMRGFHAKAHACVRGELRVKPPTAVPKAMVGLFAKEESYPVWIRYSNGVGFGQPDRKADVRGLAIKVMQVPGEKLLEGQTEATTQDFLMTNGAVTPAADSRLFVQFGKGLYDASLSKDGTALGAVEALLKTGAFLLEPEQKRVRNFLLGHVVPSSLKRGSMLGQQFWTGGAFALGVDGQGRAVNAAKMTALPGVLDADGSCVTAKRLPKLTDADYFRTDIKERMKAGRTCISLEMQLQRDPARQLIEDTSVEWKESDAPFMPVGTVVVPETDLDGDPKAQARESFCNSLGFTPWHALKEHRPLGNIMRSRKVVYERSRELRAGVTEPKGDEMP